MSKKQMTLIYYYIPEDHDNQDTPNVFGVSVSKNNIRLHHIYEHFPLKGSYIFRFKVMYDNAIAWLDLPELDTKLPTFKDKIVIKVTRISWESNSSNPYGHYRFVKKEHQSHPVTQQAPKTNVQTSIPQPVITSNNSSINATNKQHTDLLGQKHETIPTSSNTIKIDNTNLLGQKTETLNLNQTHIPSNFSFDLLSSTPTTPAQKTKSSQLEDLGSLL